MFLPVCLSSRLLNDYADTSTGVVSTWVHSQESVADRGAHVAFFEEAVRDVTCCSLPAELASDDKAGDADLFLGAVCCSMGMGLQRDFQGDICETSKAQHWRLTACEDEGDRDFDLVNRVDGGLGSIFELGTSIEEEDDGRP